MPLCDLLARLAVVTMSRLFVVLPRPVVHDMQVFKDLVVVGEGTVRACDPKGMQLAEWSLAGLRL